MQVWAPSLNKCQLRLLHNQSHEKKRKYSPLLKHKKKGTYLRLYSAEAVRHPSTLLTTDLFVEARCTEVRVHTAYDTFHVGANWQFFQYRCFIFSQLCWSKPSSWALLVIWKNSWSPCQRSCGLPISMRFSDFNYNCSFLFNEASLPLTDLKLHAACK